VLQYSGRDIPGLEDNIDARVLDLLSLIRRESAGDRPVDFARFAQYFTLDVLTHIAFGSPFGYLTQNKDIYEYIKTTTNFLQILELGTNFPLIHRILSSRPMQALFAPKPTDRIGMGAMLGVAKRVVSERYVPDAKDHLDMLGSFVRNGLNQQEAESESMLQILGGSDSTATAIRMTLLYILTNPVIYTKLMQELKANSHNISSPVIKSSEARQLPYLQSCIKEGLRMWPPISSLQSKISPPGGETVNGVFLPGGVEVAVSQVATHRRKDVYGDDANIFRPDRWIDADKLNDGGEKLHMMERTLELVFGSGRFGCLGKHVAMMELDKIFVALLQKFEWGIVDPIKPMETICWGIHVQNAFWLWARERRE
jgi:cytochrome P450